MKKNDIDVESLKSLGLAFMPSAIATLVFVGIVLLINYLQ